MDEDTPSLSFWSYLAWVASRQQWIARVKKVEDLGYSVLQVPDHLGNQFSNQQDLLNGLASLAAARGSLCWQSA